MVKPEFERVPATDVRGNEITVADIPLDKPCVFFDIDGVLNAFWWTDENPKLYKRDKSELFMIDNKKYIVCPNDMVNGWGGYIDGFSISWSSALVNAIKQLASSGICTLVWLTSWDRHAEMLANTLLWPDVEPMMLGYVRTHSAWGRSSYYGKKKTVIELRDRAVEENAPKQFCIVSFDDDYVSDDREDKTDTLPDLLSIEPDPSFGIDRSQWENAMKFIEKHLI